MTKHEQVIEELLRDKIDGPTWVLALNETRGVELEYFLPEGYWLPAKSGNYVYLKLKSKF